MISNEQKQKAIKLYRNRNLTMREIANLCDISLSELEKLVRGAIKDGAVRQRNEFYVGLSKEPKYTDAELEQIATDYYERDMNKSELTAKWGIHPMQLQRVRKRFGGRYEQKMRGNRATAKAVLQFDKDGNLIAEFRSGYNASATTGVPFQTINQCCNGKLKTSGGFVWKFKEEQQ